MRTNEAFSTAVSNRMKETSMRSKELNGIAMALLLVLLMTILLLLFTSAAYAEDDPIERRRDQFGKDFSYFLYPIASKIPGLGDAAGAGASVLNMFGTDTDFTGFYLDGDFKASGYALLDMNVVPHRLIVDAGYYDFRVASVTYTRGINSDRNNYILPNVEGAYALAQVTYSLWERMFEVYYRALQGYSRLTQVNDRNGNAFEVVDPSRHNAHVDTIGGIIDVTDDRLDPRKGVRFEAAWKMPKIDDPNQSKYYVTDYNLTGYVPFRKWDTLALNLFYSEAHVTSMASTDFATLQQRVGLGCNQLQPGPEQDQCLATERDYINQLIAINRYGNATSLGGTQRLRSFDGGRFFAGHTVFYGLEYRLNLTDEHTPFDIIIAKGIRTGLQLAFFAEQGTVYDTWHDWWKVRKTSYGTGFRVVLSGIVIRADFAQGNEGSQFQLFITYPWSMFSVDSPG
jgi:hypothetical protein